MSKNNLFSAIYKVNHAGGSGSCFYYKKHNIFITNFHVVEGYKVVSIQDNDKNSFLARVVMVNPSVDIAFLIAE
jgi:S1-C subfamily serine protease